MIGLPLSQGLPEKSARVGRCRKGTLTIRGRLPTYEEVR